MCITADDVFSIRSFFIFLDNMDCKTRIHEEYDRFRHFVSFRRLLFSIQIVVVCNRVENMFRILLACRPLFICILKFLQNELLLRIGRIFQVTHGQLRAIDLFFFVPFVYFSERDRFRLSAPFKEVVRTARMNSDIGELICLCYDQILC